MAASSSQEINMSDADASESWLVEKLKKLLTEQGIELLKPCDSVDELLMKLDKLEHLLSHVAHYHKELVKVELQPSKEALVTNEFIRHAATDVRVSVAACISEIIRITSPDEPYGDDQMKEFFQLANCAFGKLSSMGGRAYTKAVSMLQSISFSKSCIVMLDLQLYDNIQQMFLLFLDGIRASQPQVVFSSMERIMMAIIHNLVDNDECSVELTKILIATLKRENNIVSPAAFELAEKTFGNCANILKAYLPEAVKSLGIPAEEYAEVVSSLCQDLTQRDDMDPENFGVDTSCHEEAGANKDDVFPNLVEDGGNTNLQTAGNITENQRMTSHDCDKTENRSAKLVQQELSQGDFPISRKRSRKPNSLIKLEEGYDPRWMHCNVTSAEESHSQKKKRLKNSDALSGDITEKRDSAKRQGSFAKVAPATRSRPKTTISDEDDILIKTLVSHSRRISQKGEVLSVQKLSSPQHKRKSIASKAEKHLSTREGSSNKVTPGKNRAKTIISENLTKDTKTLASTSRPISSKERTLSEKVPDSQPRRKNATSNNEVFKARDSNRQQGAELLGRRIKVWWTSDKKFHKGKVAGFDHEIKLHQIEYDAGEIEFLDLRMECWKLLREDYLSRDEQRTDAAPSASAVS